VTDVARCFPSIYTHSIPWAIHGHEASKKDRNWDSDSVYANRLDFVVRQAQDGQTVGIPVGPDTSRVISEIVLSAIDKEFITRSGQTPAYLRHVDDYWVGGHSIDECERHLQNLRAALRHFELDVNEWKTKIVSTKQVFGETWPTEFEREISGSLGPGASLLGLDPISSLSKFVDQATRANDDGMIRHVIRKIDEHGLWVANWDVLEHFLAHCAVQFPHSFDYVARVVAWRKRLDKSHDLPLWTQIAESIIAEASALTRDGEVLWALWLLRELGVKLQSSLSDRIVQHSSPLILACVTHMHANGLAADSDLPAKLCARIEGDPYSGSYWPLTLELVHLDLAASLALSPSKSPLGCLHEAKASLFDWKAAPKVFEGMEKKWGFGGPGYAIEKVTSDYDDADGEDDEDKDFEFLIKDIEF
jgi:hypothetical protein